VLVDCKQLRIVSDISTIWPYHNQGLFRTTLSRTIAAAGKACRFSNLRTLKSGYKIVNKILVGLKRVIDYNVRVRVKSDGSGVETAGVKMSINPFDEIALEEALRIKERGDASEVVVVSVGTQDVQQQLRTGLAMGADRAIHVEIADSIDPLTCARSLLKIVEKEEPGLVFLGKKSLDDDNAQTGPMLAALWNRPQATFASELVLADGTARVTCEVDIGLQIIEVDLPAVVTVDLRMNEPRYVKLPDIMKAKKKPMDIIPLADLDVEVAPAMDTTSFTEPAARARGVMVDDVAGLISALTDKGVL
jgi:electron transfer flavoprotein beta subunit